MAFSQKTAFPLHYEIHEGLVDKDTVCLHGNLASNAWWEPAVAEWRKQAAGREKKGRLICAEWRGCGGSTGLRAEEELRLPELGEDYNQLLRELGARSACAIGHSAGGLIALHAMRSAPELWSRALLLDPVGATGVQFGPEMYSAFTLMSQDRGFCETIMLSTIYQGHLEPGLSRRIVEDAFHVDKAIWHGVPRMLHTADFRSELRHIHQPVLVLHGEHDLLLKKEDSIALAAGLPQGRFQELPGRGHSCNVEDAPLFVGLANGFLFAGDHAP